MISKLKRLCAQNDLELIDKGKGHWQIKGLLLVNYWPNSKKRTAYVGGTNSSKQNVTPEQAIQMALEAPKKMKPTKRKGSYKTAKKRLIKKSNLCRWCETPLTIETATIEHVIPLMRGGLNNANNYALACEPCNKARGCDMPELTEENKQDYPTEKVIHERTNN